MGGGAHPIIGEGGRYESAEQRAAHRAEVAVAAGNLERAEAEYRASPNESTQENFANAYSTYSGLVVNPVVREKAADASAAAAAAQTLGATSVDEAINTFNSGNNTSAILRTGAEAAATVRATEEQQLKTAELLAAQREAARVEREHILNAYSVPSVSTPAQSNRITPSPAPSAAAIPAAQTTIEPGEEVVTPAPAASSGPNLPESLSRAAPRYSFGSKQFTLDFPNDIMRAAYIVANSSTKSKADPHFLAFVRQQTGMSEPEVIRYGKEIKAAIKEQAKGSLDTAKYSFCVAGTGGN
jgi:hypothetical protein